jgi:hypothetical protein
MLRTTLLLFSLLLSAALSAQPGKAKTVREPLFGKALANWMKEAFIADFK